MSLKNPLRFWLILGASSVALFAVVFTLSTRTVFANVHLPLIATASNAVPASSATPALLAPQSADALSAKKQHGVASWYGKAFHGRLTASGERFNMYAMTACHPTLPFGTKVRVVDHESHRSVIVRITDRSGLVDGRIIDLSMAAANQLKMVKDGLAQVDLEILSLGNNAYRNSFGNRSN